MKTTARTIAGKKLFQPNTAFTEWIYKRSASADSGLFSEPSLFFLKGFNQDRDFFHTDIYATFYQTVCYSTNIHRTIQLSLSRQNREKILLPKNLKRIPQTLFSKKIYCNQMVQLGSLQVKKSKKIGTKKKSGPSLLRNGIEPKNQSIAILPRKSSTKKMNWKRSAKDLFQIYERMSLIERDIFLEETRLTQTDMEVLTEMTQEQWQLFVSENLLKIGNFLKKINFIATIREQQEESLRKLPDKEWKTLLKIIESQISSRTEKQLFSSVLEKAEDTSMQKETFLSLCLGKPQFYTYLENSMALHKVPEKDILPSVADFVQWLSYLDEVHWEEVRACIVEDKENPFSVSLSFLTTSETKESLIPRFSSEKQRLIELLEKEQGGTLRQEIWNSILKRKETRAYLKQWFSPSMLNFEKWKSLDKLFNVDLEQEKQELQTLVSSVTEEQWEQIRPVFLTVLSLNREEKIKPPITFDKQYVLQWIKNAYSKEQVWFLQSIRKNKDVKEMIDELFVKEEKALVKGKNQALKEWIFYMTEEEWRSVQPIFLSLLSKDENWKEERGIRNFSEEKEEVLGWLKSRDVDPDMVLQKIAEKAGTREAAEKWFGETIFKERETKVEEKRKELKALKEWIAYMTEEEWRVVQPVLTSVVSPSAKDQREIRSFSEEKEEVLGWLESWDADPDMVLQKVEEKAETREAAKKWFGETIFEGRETKVEEKGKELKALKEWIAYMTEEEWRVVQPVLTSVVSPSAKDQREIRSFSEEKEEIIKWLDKPEINPDLILQKIEEKEKIRTLASKWFRNRISKREENMKENPPGILALIKWITQMPEVQWKKIQSVFSSVLLPSEQNNKHLLFSNERQAVLHWIEEMKVNQADVILKKINENPQRQKIAKSWLNMRRDSSLTLSLKDSGRFSQIGEEVKQNIVQWLEKEKQKKESRKDKKDNSERQEDWFYIKKAIGEKQQFLYDQSINFVYSTLIKPFSNEKAITCYPENKERHKKFGIKQQEMQSLSTYSTVLEMRKGGPDISYKNADLVLSQNRTSKPSTEMIPPKIEIEQAVQKNVKEEIFDIQKKQVSTLVDRRQKIQIEELTKQLQIQKKELEQMRESQKEILRTKDISMVTEQVLQKMQRQLRLEKLRRGL